MDAAVVMQQMIIIFIIVLTGYLLVKLNIFSEQSGVVLSKLVLNVCMPALIIQSVMEAEHSISVRNLIFYLILSGIIYVVLIGLGFLIPKMIGVGKRDCAQYHLLIIFGNIGFIGVPVIIAVLGPEGVIYEIIFNIFYTVLIYTYGYVLVSQQSEHEKTFRVKDLINVGTVSSLIGIVFYLTDTTLPMILSESINYMGNATILLSTLVIGINLAKKPLKEMFSDKKIYLYVLIRQILVPVIIGFVLKLFVKDALMLGVTLILISVPAGSMPLMMAEETGVDGSVISKGVVVSTILSVITIPLVVLAVL